MNRLASAPASAPRWLAAGVFAALSVATRIPRLGAKSLWLDEAVAVHIAQLDPVRIVDASRGDTTPPLYYLVLGIFERFLGISEAAIRLPSVLASACTAAALFLLADRRIGRAAAYLVALLFVLSDVNLAYAREARPYALVSLLCVASFGLFFRAIERPAWRNWIGLALVNTAMIFTHYAAVFAIAAQGLAVVWPWRGGGRLRRFVAAHAPVALLFSAWLIPIMRSGKQANMGWLQVPGIFHAAKLLAWFTGGHQGFPGFIILFAGSVAIVVAARRGGDDERWRYAVTFALWTFVPVVLALVVSREGVRCFHARYLLYAGLGLLLLWGTAAQALPPGRRRAAAMAIACAIGGLGFGRSGHGSAPDWRWAAEVVHSRSDARVLVTPWWELQTFAYYFDPAAFRDAPSTLPRLAAEGVRPFVDAGSLDALGERHPTLTVVALGSTDTRLEQLLAARGYAEVDRASFEGMAVVRLAADRGGR